MYLQKEWQHRIMESNLMRWVRSGQLLCAMLGLFGRRDMRVSQLLDGYNKILI